MDASDSKTPRVRKPTVSMSRETLLKGTGVVRNAVLEVFGQEEGSRLVLLSESGVGLGRAPENAVELPFDEVSWTHANITWQGEEWVLQDLDSTNGTYLNSIRVHSSVLHDGDEIRIGPVRFLFRVR